jgi:hypothetical protein
MRGRGRTEPQHRWLYLAAAVVQGITVLTGGALWLVAMRLVLTSLLGWSAVSAFREAGTSPARDLEGVHLRLPNDDRSRALLTLALVGGTIVLLLLGF